MKIKSTENAYGTWLVADRDYSPGEQLYRLSEYEILLEPSYQSIQVGHALHIHDPKLLCFLNHSCAPNVSLHFDGKDLVVKAITSIFAGNELAFFYPSTEWEMSRPFLCLCAAPDCLGYISGARDLPPNILEKYVFNPHIQELLMACNGQQEKRGNEGGKLSCSPGSVR